MNSYFNKNAFLQYDGSNISTCQLPNVPNNGGAVPNAAGVNTDTDVGNLPPGAINGPGENNWDIALIKATKLTERLTLQFRTEFYNAFNHAQFSDPGGGSFGTIGFENVTATVLSSTEDVALAHTNVNPRLIQFGVHFLF